MNIEMQLRPRKKCIFATCLQTGIFASMKGNPTWTDLKPKYCCRVLLFDSFLMHFES